MNQNIIINNSNIIKRGRGRPKKIHAEGEQPTKKVGLPAMLSPTCHDIREELSMLDSYTYSRYNN